MLLGKKIITVLPAFNAEKTLKCTYELIPLDIVDEVILVDDGSSDGTVEIGDELSIKTFVHRRNLGYGANQKTCYYKSIKADADIVVMLHPDYQYDPRLVTAMASMIASGIYDVVLGSRILSDNPLRGGMPYYKYFFNRLLTAFQNLLMSTKLSEFHTGYRAFSRRVLETLPLLANSNNFLFDNQMLAQAAAFGFRIGEISCPTKYFPAASSINFLASVQYGLGVLATSILYRLWRWGFVQPPLFSPSPLLKIEHYHDISYPKSSNPGKSENH